MLIRIEPLDCAPDLERALHLVEEVLTYAAGFPGPALDQGAFRRAVSQGKWLLEKPRHLQEGLTALFGLSLMERQAVLAAFQNDVRFQDHVDDGAFSFTFFGLSTAAAEAGHALLRAFYTEVLAKAGFVGGLKRSVVEASYRRVNPRTERVCPACLGDLPPPAKRGRSQVDVDHYLPKKHYPCLSVHPRNLVLTCMPCNERMKGEEDPLGPLGGRAPGSMQESFLPYARLRPGLGEIHVEFLGSSTLRVVGNPGISFATARARNFDRIYGLSERWSTRLETLYGRLRGQVASSGTLPTVASIADHLRRVADQQGSQSETYPDAFLTSRYADWLARSCAQELLDEISPTGRAAALPDEILKEECQDDGPVEVVALNRFRGSPGLLVHYAGSLSAQGGTISTYVRLNGRDGHFPMTHLEGGWYVALNRPREAGLETVPPYGYRYVQPPAAEQDLFFYARDQGRANAWDVEVAFCSAEGHWDSRYGANYRFRYGP